MMRARRAANRADVTVARRPDEVAFGGTARGLEPPTVGVHPYGVITRVLRFSLAALLTACSLSSPAPAILPVHASPSPVAAPTETTTPRSVPGSRAVPFDSVPGRPFSGGAASATRPALILITDDLERALALEHRVATHINEPTTVKAINALDLDGQVAIAAFVGETSTLGFGYFIDRITVTPDGVIVVTARLTPPPGDTFLTMIGHPYAAVSVARSALTLVQGSRLELRNPSGARLAGLRWCGVVREGPLDWDRGARECVLDAYAAGDDAQLIIQRPTDEGAPTVWSVRAVPGGLSEVALDVSRDPLRDPGRDPVSSWACRRLVRGETRPETAPRYALSFSGCTGDGTEVAVR